MTMQTDVKAKNMTATAASAVGVTRIKGMYWVCGATAGSISIKKGSGGTELIKIDTVASATATGQILFPGEGVYFSVDPHVTLTQATSVTFFYG